MVVRDRKGGGGWMVGVVGVVGKGGQGQGEGSTVDGWRASCSRRRATHLSCERLAEKGAFLEMGGL